MFFKKLLAGANDGHALVNLGYPSLILIPTQINDMIVQGMVDTGATSSLITKSTINKLNLNDQIFRKVGDIMLGDSQTRIKQYGWINLDVNIKGRKFGIKAIVVDHLTNELILGMDFMRKFRVNINMTHQQLVLQHQQQQVHVEFGQTNCVRLSRQYTIHPRCKLVVDAMVNGIMNCFHL